MRFQKLYAILLVLFAGCSSNPTSTTITVLSSKGSVAGVLTVYTRDGYLVNDASGFKVEADGSDYTTSTKVDGTWQLDSVPQGTHVFTFSKDGYFTVKRFNVLVPGPGVQYLYNLSSGVLWTTQLKIDSCSKPDIRGNVNLYYSCTDGSKIPNTVIVDIRAAPFPNSDSVITLGESWSTMTPDGLHGSCQFRLVSAMPQLLPLYISIMARGYGQYTELPSLATILSPVGPRSSTYEAVP